MVKTQDIHSLSDFQRNTKEHMVRLKETGRPEVLTVNGKAEIVVLSAHAFDELIDRIETEEGIRRGLSSIEQGEGRPASEFFAEMSKKHRLTPK